MNLPVPEKYPMGATLLFVDANATVTDGLAGACRGTINGDPMTDDDGHVVFVPAFTQRDHGREATTVYVHITNILGVE